MMTTRRNNCVSKSLDFSVVILIAINSGLALTNGANILLIICQILLTVFICLSKGKIIIRSDYKLLSACLMLLFVLGAFVVNFDFKAYKTYIMVVLFIFNAYLVYSLYDIHKVLSIFLKIMFVMAIVNIIISLLNYIVPISSYAPVIQNGYGVEYYTLGLVNFSVDTFTINQRCSGIFWEPGVFAGFLSLAAVVDLCVNDDSKQIRRLLIYCVALLIIASTSGYFYMLIIILMMLSRRIKKTWANILVVVLAVTIVVLFSRFDQIIEALAIINPNAFEKLLYRNDSYTIRAMSPLADLKIMIHNIFGVGLGNIQNARNAEMSLLGHNITITTSTLTYYGASCGLLFFITYNYLWIKNILSLKKTVFIKLLAGLLFAMVLTSNPMFNNQFIWILLFTGFVGYYNKTTIDNGVISRNGNRR